MASPDPECPGCRELRALVGDLRRLIEGQQKRIAELEARVNKTSRNSSKPPSSDPPGKKKSPKKKPSGRKRGGQPGHKGHHRPLLSESEVDHLEHRFPAACSGCGNALPPDAEGKPVRRQIWELPHVKPGGDRVPVPHRPLPLLWRVDGRGPGR